MAGAAKAIPASRIAAPIVVFKICVIVFLHLVDDSTVTHIGMCAAL